MPEAGSEQRDAVGLTRPTLPIVIGLESVHDGHVEENWIYFATVDTNLILVDRNTLEVSNVVDLKFIARLKSLENLNWVKHAFHDVESPHMLRFTTYRLGSASERLTSRLTE